MNTEVKRGQIWYANLPKEEIGSVQSGRRPVLITQTNALNRKSTTVIVAIITSKLKKQDYPTHVVLPEGIRLPKASMVEAEQRKTISKSQLVEYRCTLDDVTMAKVTRALKASESPDRTSFYYINKRKQANVRK